MREVPNNIVSELCRYLPMLLANLDQQAVRNSLRLSNAVRVTKHSILPKLNKIDNPNGDKKRKI